MGTRLSRRTAALAVLLVSGAAIGPLGALTMTPRNLVELAGAAQDIVVGTVSKVSEGRQGQLMYTQVEVRVSEVVQGAPAQTLTFRQVGGLGAQEPVSGRRYIGRIEGMPRYATGENVILFLTRTSSLGFRAPVGLQQGKFTVMAGNAVNEVGNLGLFKGVTTGTSPLSAKQQAMLATRQGGVQADTFIEFLRQGVHKRWWKKGIR